MLTADMVRVRRRGDTLQLQPLVPASASQAKAQEALRELASLAERILETLRDHVGESREEVLTELQGVPVRARLQKVAAGLRKLALDACEFEAEGGDEAPELRASLFETAATLRREAASQQEFSVAETVSAFAEERGVTPEVLMRRLFADLRGHHRLLSAPTLSGTQLLEAYDLGQAQAVLLRATALQVVVSDTHAATLRYLFRKLKFHGLMHTITALPAKKNDAGERVQRYEITLDGPLSLFQASTKYGLSLALTLPALRACQAFELSAQVLWGKERAALTFELQGGRGDDAADKASAPGVRPEVEALVASFAKKDTGWKVSSAGKILNVPGLGVCVPDLTFTHRESGHCVHLEVMGFWSRDAVFRRVELVQAGLKTPMIFAVPARLRVSEEVLEDGLPASLYVFKSVLSRKAILERLEASRLGVGEGS